MSKPNAADLSKIFSTLENVEESQLEFLIENSRLIELKQDDTLYRPNEDANDMHLMLEGRIRIYAIQNDEVREFFILTKGDITSILPYSRMEKHIGYAVALEDSRLLAFPRDKMTELIQGNYELTEALVHLMSTRIREFTTSRLQNEKMMALGKLSAGLAHEMNNPSAAIVRSSKALLDHLKQRPEQFKRVMEIHASPIEIEAVSKVLFSRLDAENTQKLSLMERQDLEDDLTDCLLDFDVPNAEEIAENLVDFRFSCDDLQKLQQITLDDFPTMITWMNENLTTEKMVKEIEEASKRISELVGSVKSFTHMDRSQEKTPIDIHSGIESTLTMLNHKIRSHKVRVEKSFTEPIPSPMGNVGALNQVWTNILDNALDALEETEKGNIRIETSHDTSHAKVLIRDNGPGIASDVINRIFDPFFTTKDIGKGTGLGLEVVQNIIDQHGGQIKVTSEPGDTAFEIKLPLN